MSDYGHDKTDAELAQLERRIAKEYKKAHGDMQKKVTDYFSYFEVRDAEQRALLDKGEITEQYYRQWRLAQIGRGERFEALRDQIAQRMTKANEIAVSYANDATPGIYALNRNYAAYTIEQVSGEVGFTLWDEQTVRTMIAEAPDVMPYYPPKRALKRGIDLAWGKRQITAQVTQSLLVGESLKGVADRLQSSITDMNRASAIRTARTAITAAENAGRIDTYIAAEKIGVKLKKQWMATLDGRTRHTHAMLDGVSVANEDKFSNGCRFPGDPSGPANEIYNCRCTMIADIEDSPYENAQRRTRGGLAKDMTYQEWAQAKDKEQFRRKGYTHREKADNGHQIITKTEYNAITKDFLKHDGIIVRGEDAARHLKSVGASASYVPGMNTAFIRNDATISDVLEEMYHAEQDRRHAFGEVLTNEVYYQREIEAQKYLINCAKKYNIPLEEQGLTKSNLAYYESKLKEMRKGGD